MYYVLLLYLKASQQSFKALLVTRSVITYKVSFYTRTSLVTTKVLLLPTPFVATVTTTSSILTNNITKLTAITIIISNYPRNIINLIHSPNTYNKVDIINIIVDIIVASYAVIRNTLYIRK